MYLWRMLLVTLFSPICWRACTTSSHVAFGRFCSHRFNISILCRSFHWWSLLIFVSSSAGTPRLIPSWCQLVTVFSSAQRFFKFSTLSEGLGTFVVCTTNMYAWATHNRTMTKEVTLVRTVVTLPKHRTKSLVFDNVLSHLPLLCLKGWEQDCPVMYFWYMFSATVFSSVEEHSPHLPM